MTGRAADRLSPDAAPPPWTFMIDEAANATAIRNVFTFIWIVAGTMSNHKHVRLFAADNEPKCEADEAEIQCSFRDQ